MRFLFLISFLTLLISAESLLLADNSSNETKKVEFIIKGTEEHFIFDTIEKIEKWGIVVEDKDLKKTVLYKVIKTAVLYDSVYVNDIKKYVSNLNITIEQKKYFLDFKEAVIPVLEYHPFQIIDYKHYTFNVRPDLVEPLEIGLIYSLWPDFSLHHRLTISSGLPYSRNPSYHVMAFNYGIGYSILKFNSYEISLFMNYHLKILEKTFNGGSDFVHKHIFALETNGYIKKNSKIFPSLGIRYYFNNIPIKENVTNLTFLLGLNIKI